MYKRQFRSILFLAVNILSFSKADGQPAVTVTDLPAIVVHSKRLTVGDILDSVLTYSAGNYLLPPAYKGDLTISLTSQDLRDTLFKHVVPVTLLRKGKKKDEYRLYRIAGTSNTKAPIARLTPEQKMRLIDITTIPQNSLSQFVQAEKNAVVSQPAFFGSSFSDSCLFYHIIVRFEKLKMNAVSGIQSSAISTDTTMTFLSMIVARSDWSLRQLQCKTLGVDKDLAMRFRKAIGYADMRDMIDQSGGNGRRFWEWTYYLRKNAEGKYVPARVEVQDNLLNFSRVLFKKAENPEASIYHYNLTIEAPLAETPANATDKFHLAELLY